MLELLVDDLIQICGLSLIDIALGNVIKLPIFPAIAAASANPTEQFKRIPVVFHLPGELIVVDKPADLVINSNDKNRVNVFAFYFNGI